MNKTSLIMSLCVTALLIGCGDGSTNHGILSFGSSLKPASQVKFENEIKSLNAELKRERPGTRAYEQATQALRNFWKDKQKNMSSVDGWVCVYSFSTPWDPKRSVSNPNSTTRSRGSSKDDQYQLLGADCTDADKPLKGFEIARGGEMTVYLKVSKATNIESLYYGDVIQVTGAVDLVRPYELASSYQIWINADSLKIVKRGS